MATSDIKLLGMWASPYVLRARIVLNIKEVAYEYQEEALANKSDLLLKSNPIYKKVPVLIHDGKPICESMIIVQYVDEVWTSKSRPSLLPSDPYGRAMARFWSSYIDDKWSPNFISIVAAQTEEAKVEIIEQVLSGLKLIDDYFAESCKEKPFFGGESIGYVDLALGGWLAWIKVAEEICSIKLLDEGKTPNLVKWAERFSSDERVKEVVPEHAKLLEYCKMLQEKFYGVKSSS